MIEKWGEVEPVIIKADVWRRIWFETGGGDIYGDATDEELALAEGARANQANETED